jgi:Tol biopolymer transport system component
MQTKILGLCLAILLFSCKEENKEEAMAAREIQQYTIEQFMDNEAVGGGSFSADNSNLLVSSNRSGIYNVYNTPTIGGEMTAITTSDSTSVFAESYFPNDNRMLLSADGNGDEIDHLFVRDLEGTIKDITPANGAKALFYGWSEDDQYLYYGSNKRDPRYFDTYKM